MRKGFRYPYSFRWVLLSFILVFTSFILVFITMGNQSHLFLVLAFPQIILFTWVKYKQYQTLETIDGNPLIPIGEAESGGFLNVFILVLFVFFGFALPFILLFLLDPITWFNSILSFVVGINMPELILYMLGKSFQIDKKKEIS